MNLTELRAAIQRLTGQADRDYQHDGFRTMLRNVRQQAWQEQKSMLDRAGEQNRGLLSTEQRDFDARSTCLAELDTLLTRVEEKRSAIQQARDNAGRIAYLTDADRVGHAAEQGAPLALRSDQRLADHPDVAARIAEARDRHHQTTSGYADELSYGRFVRGVVTGRWDGADAERRAMSEGVLSGGGYLVPVDLSTSIIDRARNMGAVYRAGAQTVPMLTEYLNIARLVADPVAAFRAEGTAIPATDAAFDSVTLKAKSLAALTVISREALEDAHNLNQVVTEATAAQVALAIDLAALYGSGVDPQPRGVKNTTGVTLYAPQANGFTPTVWDELIDAVFTCQDNNETANAIVWSPRSARRYAKLKDTQNRPMLAPPAVADLPQYATNQLPNNLTQGTSSAASDVIVGDFTKIIIGLRTELQLQVLSERYADTGQVGLLTWTRMDLVVARPKAFTVLTGVL